MVGIIRPIKRTVNSLVRFKSKVYIIHYLVEPIGKDKDYIVKSPE